MKATIEARFCAKVKKSADCWEWIGTKRQGYGLLKIDGRHRQASRVSWEIHCGDAPGRMCVLHRCDNPGCVNPKHLFLGTQTENIGDMDAKGRRGSLSGDANGNSKLTWPKVGEIRRRVAAGEQHRRIATDFGVDRSLIGLIANNRIWKDGAACLS